MAGPTSSELQRIGGGKENARRKGGRSSERLNFRDDAPILSHFDPQGAPDLDHLYLFRAEAEWRGHRGMAALIDWLIRRERRAA